MASVVLRNVGKSFGSARACSGIDLNIESGELFTFLGPSGCGKTTILRLIAGFMTPDEGSVLIGGKDMTHLAPEMRRVGMVFQNYALFPHLTVYGNIEYGLKISGSSAAQIRDRVGHYMEMVGLEEYAGRSVSELSGGEQQRVALARSLAVEPQVLLLDEPLCNLDARLREKMRSEIRSLQRKLGITTIFVTHDQTEALTLSDRIAVFERGGLAQVGTPQQVYSCPSNSFVARFVGDTNLYRAEIVAGTAMLRTGMTISLSDESASGKYVSIRPQDIVISGESSAGMNILEGIVKEVQHNGLWVSYAVQVQDMCFHAAVLNRASDKYFSVDERVFLSFSGDDVKVLKN